jgi:hypothetical protein
MKKEEKINKENLNEGIGTRQFLCGGEKEQEVKDQKVKSGMAKALIIEGNNSKECKRGEGKRKR